MTGLYLILFVVVVFGISVVAAPKGWRTRVFNWVSIAGTGLWTAVGVVIPAFSGVDFSGFLTAKEAAFASALIAVGNAILREVTDTPPGKSS